MIGHDGPADAFWGGMVFGCGGMLFAWLWQSPPPHVENWRDGWEGERRTERALRALEAEGWFVEHDVPARRGNWDHIAVGPAGVFLIDSKTYAGSATVRADRVAFQRLGGEAFDHTQPLGDRMRASAFDLRAELGRLVDAPPRVMPVAAMWGTFPERVVARQTFAFVAGSAVAEWLLEQPEQLTGDRVAEIAAAVGALAASRSG